MVLSDDHAIETVEYNAHARTDQYTDDLTSGVNVRQVVGNLSKLYPNKIAIEIEAGPVASGKQNIKRHANIV
jgi:hypothetical protein